MITYIYIMIPIIVLGVRLWQIILRRRGSAAQRGAGAVMGHVNWRCSPVLMGKTWENLGKIH
jgi:hypothetical protein